MELTLKQVCKPAKGKSPTSFYCNGEWWEILDPQFFYDFFIKPLSDSLEQLDEYNDLKYEIEKNTEEIEELEEEVSELENEFEELRKDADSTRDQLKTDIYNLEENNAELLANNDELTKKYAKLYQQLEEIRNALIFA